MRHARDFGGAEEFAGRRVLVVGCGKSGADIACDAALLPCRAKPAPGHWFIPKYVAGLPTGATARGSRGFRGRCGSSC